MAIYASAGDKRALVLRVARAQVPEILLWAGLLTLVFALVNYLTLPEEGGHTWVINVIFGPLFLGVAWAYRRGRLPDASLPWAWAACSLALVLMLVETYRLQPTAANLAYIAVVMAVFAPVTHGWLPFVVAAVLMEGTALLVFAMTESAVVARENALVCAAALMVGAALLRLRLNALSTTADIQAELAHQAMFDPMTDVLNRNGFDRSASAVRAAAQRNGESVLVWFIDIRGLKRANDELGHQFGDELIRGVAVAVRTCIRTNDLLIRWGGDEFLVLGSGHSGSAAELNERVDAVLAADPKIAGRWRGRVTVGFASGSSDDDLSQLVARADSDMYRRRSAS